MAKQDLNLFGDELPPVVISAEVSGPHPSFCNVSATVFRCVDYDTPVWDRPNSRAGRWHHSGRGITAQYWSYTASTAWGEVLRGQGIKDEKDVREMRVRTWAGQVQFTQIADLTDERWRHWLGLTEEDLLRDDHGACRDAGQALIECEAHGLIAPSAAIRGRLNLVLFKRLIRGDWVESRSGAATLRFPEKMLPCHLISYGYPSPDIVNQIRYRQRDGPQLPRSTT